MPGTDVVTVFVTAPGKEPALALARQVVEESLAACGNVIPNVTSVFRWDEKVNVEEEVLLILKTSAVKSPALIARVAELHTYEVPEVLSVRVEDGFGPYLDWVHECTSGEAPPAPSVEKFDGRQ
jgi:periplasmic divalent cation tolerance protein